MPAKRKRKILYPAGTKVKFSYSWYGRSNRHDGHECVVVSSKIVRRGNRNYYKYRLKDIADSSEFSAEDLPPTEKITVLD
jgi:hypothetical protein